MPTGEKGQLEQRNGEYGVELEGRNLRHSTFSAERSLQIS